jgi:hypothetical protein
MMPPAFAKFFDEARADGRMPDGLVDEMEEITRETVAECSEHPDTVEFLDALSWIFKQRSRSVLEKLEAVRKLTGLPRGKVSIPSMRKFLGWDK